MDDEQCNCQLQPQIYRPAPTLVRKTKLKLFILLKEQKPNSCRVNPGRETSSPAFLPPRRNQPSTSQLLILNLRRRIWLNLDAHSGLISLREQKAWNCFWDLQFSNLHTYMRSSSREHLLHLGFVLLDYTVSRTRQTLKNVAYYTPSTFHKNGL